MLRTCLPMQETRGEGSIPGSGRFPGGHVNPLQCSFLENPIGILPTVHRVTKIWT